MGQRQAEAPNRLVYLLLFITHPPLLLSLSLSSHLSNLLSHLSSHISHLSSFIFHLTYSVHLSSSTSLPLHLSSHSYSHTLSYTFSSIISSNRWTLMISRLFYIYQCINLIHKSATKIHTLSLLPNVLQPDTV